MTGAGPARVLTADCPWKFGDALPGLKRGAVKHYPCMPVDEIARFPLPPMERDSFLFLWYVTAMVDEARFVCRAWGFTPTGGELTWIKTTRAGCNVEDPEGMREGNAINRLPPSPFTTKLAFGMGRTVRNCDERCLIARRGKPKVTDRSVRSVFFAPVGEHSAKPDRFYKIVERLSPGPYVELFARRERQGWQTFGNELAIASPALSGAGQ